MNRRQMVLGVSGAALAAAPMSAWAQTDPVLKSIIDNPARLPANSVRDRYRHPMQSLMFWGLKPGMTVVEVDPGDMGYWNELLVPYAKATGGTYIASAAPHFKSGASTDVELGLKSGPIAAPGTADLVLTARNIHNMMWEKGLLPKALKDFHDVLKPNGVFAVEEHRADPVPQYDTAKRSASNGYVAVKTVVSAVQTAGFKLDGQAEINANPHDTKDYIFGVWTLPPFRQTFDDMKALTPAERAKFDAIGESDRMTLRFRKV